MNNLVNIKKTDVIDGVLKLPENVDIDISNFDSNKIKVNKIILPKSYKYLHSYSLSCFKDLKEINLDNVEKIGENVFFKDINLKEANLINLKEIYPKSLSWILNNSQKIIIDENFINVILFNMKFLHSHEKPFENFFKLRLLQHSNKKNKLVCPYKIGNEKIALLFAKDFDVILNEKVDNRDELQKYVDFYSNLYDLSEELYKYRLQFNSIKNDYYENRIKKYKKIDDYLINTTIKCCEYLIRYNEIDKYDDDNSVYNLLKNLILDIDEFKTELCTKTIYKYFRVQNDTDEIKKVLNKKYNKN